MKQSDQKKTAKHSDIIWLFRNTIRWFGWLISSSQMVGLLQDYLLPAYIVRNTHTVS